MTLRIFVPALLAGCLSLLTLVGCGGGSPPVAGTYTLDKAAMKSALLAQLEAASPTEPGIEREMATAMASSVIDMMDMTITLNDDGSASGSFNLPGQASENPAGTWTLTGDSIAITLASSGEAPHTQVGTYSSGTITISDEAEDMVLVFRK